MGGGTRQYISAELLTKVVFINKAPLQNYILVLITKGRGGRGFDVDRPKFFELRIQSEVVNPTPLVHRLFLVGLETVGLASGPFR